MILREGHKGLRLAFEGERVTLRDSGMKIMRLKYPLHKLLYFITVAAILLPQQIISQTQSPSQSPTQPSANSSAANTTKPYTAKANCTSNGTYVNSKGQTVKRPGVLLGTAKGSDGAVCGWNLQLQPEPTRNVFASWRCRQVVLRKLPKRN